MQARKPHRKLINPLWTHHRGHLFLQVAIVALIIFLALFAIGFFSTLDDVLGAIGTSSLAASAFIVFALPDAPVSNALRMVGSYAIALGVGLVLFTMTRYLAGGPIEHADFVLLSIGGSLAVGITMLIMIILRLQHPPAAGFALGLVMDDWHYITIIVMIFGLSLLVIARQCFYRHLLATLGADNQE